MFAKQIKFLPDNAFVTLRLKTLKLSGNNLTFADHCFRGLETSLKNLNLKGCQLKAVPSPVRTLQGLAFLDVAQNKIRDLESGIFESMSSITALNLERNVIQSLDPLAFEGVSDTLSSLSLLNNLLTEFPLLALKTLPKLRVSGHVYFERSAINDVTQFEQFLLSPSHNHIFRTKISVF